MICFAIRDRLRGMTALVLFLFASSSLLPLILVNCQVFTGAIRLSGGKSPHEGNVQIYYGKRWGFVCDDHWTIGEANVVCKQLGYPKARNSTIGSHFSVLSNSLNIFLDDVQCSGNETALMHCRHNTWGVHDCIQAEYAGVVCQSPENFTVRLTPAKDEYQGVVEIGLLGQWYKVVVADKATWDVSKSGILCREMGYPGALSSSHVAWSEEPRNHSGAGNQWGNTVHMLCEGHERHVSECMIDLPRPTEPGIFRNSVSSVLHIACQRYSIAFKTNKNLLDNFARVIINNVSRISPRIDSSGMACGDWSEQDARVVCRQAGFIGLDNIKTVNVIVPHRSLLKIPHLGCNGNESDIAQCTPNLRWKDDKTCGGQRSLAVKCTSPVPRITSLLSVASHSVEVRWMVDNLTETHIITGYDVCYSTLNTETPTCDTVKATTVTDSVAVIGGLRPFKNYTFTVSIKTVYGDTQRSEPKWIVTTIPGAPQIAPDVLRVSPDGPSRLNIELQRSLHPGINGPLLSYSVVYQQANPSGRNMTVSFNIANVDSALVLTGLTAFTNYSVRVAFVNANGTGPFSEEIIATTGQDAPSKVENLAVVALGSTSVGLSWMAPLHPNGIITKYCVRYRSESPLINHSETEELSPSVTNITIHNLQEYTNYTFRVFAKTVAGKGGAVKTTVTLFPAAPASPWNASAIGINLTTVNVSWTPPPPKDRNGPIANYSVICEKKGLNESVEKFTRTTWLIFDNLTSYISYSYKVAAVGLFNGTGAYTKPFQDDIQRVPGPVGGLNVSSIQKTSCFVRWDKPSWTNGVISNYILNFTSTENGPYHHRMIPIQAQGKHVLYQVRDLEESVDYSISVFAVNQHGVGAGRYLEMKTKADVPSAPPRAVNISTEESCIVVSWMPPNLTHQNGPINYYVVKYGELDAHIIKITHNVKVEPQRSLDPMARFTYRIKSTETSLKMNVVYLVQVAAKTDVGVGPFSDSIPVKLEGPSINAGSVAAGVIVVILILVVAVGLILVLVYAHKKWKRVKSVLLQKASSNSASRQGHIYEEPKCANSKTGSIENVYDIPGVSSSEGCYAHQTNQKVADAQESGPLCKSTLIEHEECDDVSIGEHTLESRRALRLSSSPDFVDNPLYGSLVQSLPESSMVFVADSRLSVPTLPRNSSVTSSPRKEHYSVSYSHQSSSGPTFPKASFSESVMMSELEQRQDSEAEDDVYAKPDAYIFLNSFGSETPHVLEETAVVHESDNLYSHLWTTEPVMGDDCGPLDTPNVPPERTVVVESDNPYSHLWSETPRMLKPTAVADEPDNLYSHLWTTKPFVADTHGSVETSHVPEETTVSYESDNPYSQLRMETSHVREETAVADESENLYSHLWTTKPFVADTHGSVETSHVPEETAVSYESDNPYSRLRMETSHIRVETAVAGESENLYSHLWTTKTFVEDDRGLTDTANAEGYCNFTENTYQNMPSIPRLSEDTSDSESDDDQKPKRINIYDVPRRVLQQHDVVDPPQPASMGGVPSTSHNDTEPVPQFGVCTTFNTDPCESKH